jgi:hypothetical protein
MAQADEHVHPARGHRRRRVAVVVVDLNTHIASLRAFVPAAHFISRGGAAVARPRLR